MCSKVARDQFYYQGRELECSLMCFDTGRFIFTWLVTSGVLLSKKSPFCSIRRRWALFWNRGTLFDLLSRHPLLRRMFVALPSRMANSSICATAPDRSRPFIHGIMKKHTIHPHHDSLRLNSPKNQPRLPVTPHQLLFFLPQNTHHT